MSGQSKPHEHKVFSFELKEVSLEDSVFTGYSAAMGNRDLGNDIIEPGAFKKTIRERVDRRYIKLLDNHNAHSTRDVWGTVVDAEEVKVPGSGDNAPTHKLLTTFEVSRADANAQTALKKIAERHLDQLSIGFRSLREEYEADEDSKEEDPRWAWLMGNGTRTIKEVQWWETSVVIWAMNPEAQILANSVTSLLDFATKAAQSGVHVPEDTVRETIRALSMLTGDPVAEPTDEVHAAVARVKTSLDRLNDLASPDIEVRLRALAQEYSETHGDPNAQKFSVWVDEQLSAEATAEDLDLTPAEDDGPDGDEKEDAPAIEADAADEPDEEIKEEEDADAADEATPEQDRPEDAMSLAEAALAIKDAADRLVSTLAIGDTDEGARSQDDPADDPGSRGEEEEAAKGADDDDVEGRTEHFPDGDELALAVAELSVLELDLQQAA